MKIPKFTFKKIKKNKTPSLGICIPVWNKGELFKICFDSLLGNLQGLEVTIWIYDNGSDDETHKIIESLHSSEHRIYKTYFPENMGIPYIANLFSQAVQEDCDYTYYKAPQYVMLMDADAYFKKPLRELIHIIKEDYNVGMLTGHDSIEHKAISEWKYNYKGKEILLLEKENERMITMIMRKEEFVMCHPFPHYRNRDVDWEITQWNQNSLKLRNRKIFAAPDYVLHLGIMDSTWNTSKDVLASEQEIAEVKQILGKNKLMK